MCAAPLEPGDFVADDFQVERVLAEGGMGTLYIALQRSTGQRRALKVMNPRLAENARACERFVAISRSSMRCSRIGSTV